MNFNSLYFCYGSNLNIEQMAVRCPDAKPIKKVILKDYKLQFCGKNLGVATIEPCIGSEVVGGLWEITERCLVALDRYEGYPRLYNRTEVVVCDEEGNQIKAMTYYMVNNPPLALPSNYYFDVILKGYADFGLVTKPLHKTLSDQRKIMRADM